MGGIPAGSLKSPLSRPPPPPTGVVPFVALLLLQRRPVAGRALLVNGPGCPGNSLCRANVHEQTRKQVALLNATAQDLFSLYVSDTRGDGAWGGRTAGWPSCGASRWPWGDTRGRGEA